MNLKPLTGRNEIREAYKQFERRMTQGTNRIDCAIGWQGGGTNTDLHWNSELRLWSHFEAEGTENRYWCVFAVDDPASTDMPNITCEINIPFEGINRRVAAVFARDSLGKVFLVHNGRVGGGRKGIMKKTFWEFYEPQDVCILEWPDGRTSEAIVISGMSDSQFQSKIARFVHKVDEFKNLAVEGGPPRAAGPPKCQETATISDMAYHKAVEQFAEILRDARSGKSLFLNKFKYSEIIDDRDRVLERYQSVFSPGGVSRISADEFKSFLLFKNNRHWTQMHRFGDRACENMGRLRKALALLLDESRPIAPRLTDAVHMVRGFDKGTATPILMIAYPEKYGVWNNRSEKALKTLGIWPEIPWGLSRGERYVIVNDVINRLAKDLHLDLWSMDALFWYYDAYQAPQARGGRRGTSAERAAIRKRRGRPPSSRKMLDFLRENWESTELGKDWMPLRDAATGVSAFDYSTDIGRIDIVARHKRSDRLLIATVTTKPAGEAVVGRILKCMGWAKEKLAKSGEQVEGLIITSAADEGLNYALKAAPIVRLMLYESGFKLKST
jgi:hypothetical protein